MIGSTDNQRKNGRLLPLNLNRERGQSLVEMALVMPILVFLLLLAADFGRVYHDYIIVVASARVAAEVASDTTKDSTAVLAAAARENNTQLDPLTFTVTLSGTRASGNTVSVTTTSIFTPITPLISDLLGGNLTLQASATARCY